MTKWKDLRAVCERYRAFSGGIEHAKDEDEQCNERNVCAAVLRDERTHPSGKQTPSHIGKYEEQKATSTEGVDDPNRRPCKGKIGQAEAPREQKKACRIEACGGKDGRRIKLEVCQLLRELVIWTST